MIRKEELFTKNFLAKYGRIFILALFILTSSFFTSGCEKEIPQDKVVIEFWTLQLSNYKDYINQVIHAFEVENKTIKIKWVDVPFSEGEKKALNGVLSNKPPDLINLNPEFSGILAKHKALANILDIVDRRQLDQYLPTAVDLNSIDQDYVFGVPWYITSSVTLYNEDILKNAGIDLHTVENTYEFVRKTAHPLSLKKDTYSIMPNFARNGKLFIFLMKHDINLFDPSIDINSAAEILNPWINMYKEGLLPKEIVSEGHQGAVNRYQAGNLGFIEIGPNFLTVIKENAMDVYKNTRVMGQLQGSSPYIDFSNMNLIIPKKSKHQKEALQFALFLTNANNQLTLSKLVPVLPSHMEALQSPYFSVIQEGTIEEKARLISAKQLMTMTRQPVYRIYMKDIKELIDYAIQNCLLNNFDTKFELNKLHAKLKIMVSS